MRIIRSRANSMWASGVTHQRSSEARQDESARPDSDVDVPEPAREVAW